MTQSSKLTKLTDMIFYSRNWLGKGQKVVFTPKDKENDPRVFILVVKDYGEYCGIHFKHKYNVEVSVLDVY